jgi:hypothetical protein
MGYPEGLNQNEKEFLTFHDVKPEQTFNAEGMSKSEYRPLMKRDGQIVAFNTTPCNAAGHQLRTRSGHCVMCNSAPLGFQKRNDLSGYVYVAGSILGQMLKVGFSNNYENRELLLNQQNYGGFDDWKNLLVLFSANGGRLELQLHSKLKIYSTSRDYFHDDHYQKATEIFHCSVSKVLEALELVDSNFRTVKQKDFTDYQFRNLTK